MNRKQKIIVSITGIFIVLFTMIGLTYGYFLTRINGNKNSQSISVLTAKLELIYGDDNGYIIGENEYIKPGTKFRTKTFTVTNNGNSTIDNYAVILENVKTFYTNTFIDANKNEVASGTQVAFKNPKDFKLKITCSSEKYNSETKQTETSSCNGMDGYLPLMTSTTLDETYITNGILVSNSIDVGEKHTYSVDLEYIDASYNQSDDMNKTLEGKFNIIDANNTIDIIGTVDNHESYDSIVTNSVRRESQINNDGTYKIVGLETSLHSIKTKSGNVENEIGKISIIKGNEENVGTTTINGTSISQITIKDSSRLAKVDLKSESNKLEIENEIQDSLYWYETMEDSLLTLLNENQPNSTVVSNPETEAPKDGEARVILIEDDYDVSSVYRGNVTNNYVNYSGMCWRVLRIQGNGTVKLVLADENNECDKGYSLSNTKSGLINGGEPIYIKGDFNVTSSIDGIYGAVFSYKRSNIPEIINEWSTRTNKPLDVSKLANTDWCHTVNVDIDESGIDEFGNPSYIFDFSSKWSGFYYFEALKKLKCDRDIENRYFEEIYNNYIGILNSAELYYSGSTKESFLNKNAENQYWLMTPSEGELECNGWNCVAFSMYWGTNTGDDYEAAVRPVIVLRNDVEATVYSNSQYDIGTYQNPYKIN